MCDVYNVSRSTQYDTKRFKQQHMTIGAHLYSSIDEHTNDLLYPDVLH